MPQTDKGLNALMIAIRAQMAENPGAGEHRVTLQRGAVPFSLPASVKRAAPVVTEGESQVRAESGAFIVEGIASSTSVDWYGTEMSLGALDDMAAQFNAGVDLLPSHGGFLASIEWDEVLGKTFLAAVERAEVADAADPEEDGFILKVQARVPETAPRADQLAARLDDGQEIGLSIGGWFLEVRYITSEDGDLERIIIERVKLDHLAVVRNPANPDSGGLKMLSAALHDVMAEMAAADAVETTTIPESAQNRDKVTPLPPVDRGEQPSQDTDNAGAEVPAPSIRSDQMPMQKILDQLTAMAERQAATDAKLDELTARSELPEVIPEEIIESVDPAEHARAVAAAVTEALAARAADEAAAAAATAAANAEDPKLVELRAKVAKLESSVSNRDKAMASMIESGRSGRRGASVAVPVIDMGATTRAVATKAIQSMIEHVRGRDDDAPVLCAMVERNITTLNHVRQRSGLLPRGAEGGEYLAACHDAPSVLHALCAAADEDGILGCKSNGLGWRE